MKLRILCLTVGLLLALSASASPGVTTNAEGKLNIIAKFPASAFGGELDVATFTENAEKVGLLGIMRDKRVSFAFHPNEWDSLIQLFHKAEPVQSASWQFVGTLKEVGTKDPTLLLVTAGPGVMFTMETAEGSFAVVVNKNDFERLDASLRETDTFLAN